MGRSRQALLKLAPLPLAALCACARPSFPALNAPDDTVQSISIEHAADSFVLVQSPLGRWRVDPLKGVIDEADAVGAERLLSGLRALRVDADVPGDAAAAGLSGADAVSVAVFVSGRNDAAFTARFGRRALGGALYAAARADAPTAIVEGPDPALLSRSASDWRELRLLTGDCTRVEVAASRRFRAASPATAAALCAARAARLAVDSPPEVTGMSRPSLRVRTRTSSLTVGARLDGERWIRVDGRPGLFLAPAEVFETAAAEAAR
ncbi:MAG: hypothetical protein HKL90_02525 [Elusimicrobia bacterium]|nr:hypothetical protein [Elusimicrobiota bacterium]